MKLIKPRRALFFLTAATALVAGYAFAVPINITAQLTGDVRQANGENPQNLIVDVTITSDTTSNVASFVVDINSPLHPSIKLDEFYFNVTGLAGDYSFANFTPADWNFGTPASVQGAGGTSFLFEILDPAGPPNAADVTNSVNLTFDLLLNAGTFTDNIFLNAPVANSNDAGSGQLGAHLQSLDDQNPLNCPNGCDTDSGFAFGSYSTSTSSNGSTGGPGSGNGVPAPGPLALLGVGGLAAAFAWRRRRNADSD